MIPQLAKELKLLMADYTIVFAALFLIISTGLFLWIFPDSSYQSYGIASSELYFETMNWMALLWVPALASTVMTLEYKSAMISSLHLLPIGWARLIWAKFIAVFLVVICLCLLSATHLIILDAIGVFGIQNLRQTVISFLTMLCLFSCYIALGLYISSIVRQPMIALILAIISCFLFYQGFELISRIPALWGTSQWGLSVLSLSYHASLISRGVLALSTILYILSLVIGFNYLTSASLSKIRND